MDEQEPTTDWTHAEIDEWGHEHGIEFPSGMTKAEKIDVLNGGGDVVDPLMVTVVQTSPYGRPGDRVQVTRTRAVERYLANGVLREE